MRILRPTTQHEMERRWVLGEIDSPNFGLKNNQLREATRSLLLSGDRQKEELGICRQWRRFGIMRSFPSDTKWSTAQLELTESDFALLRTIQEKDGPDRWKGLTRGTYKLIDAAKTIDADASHDPRIAKIVQACRQGRLDPMGLTLFSQGSSGIYTVAEGTGRLVALYICRVAGAEAEGPADSINVMLGESAQAWRWSR
jgi:hypothetical protein